MRSNEKNKSFLLIKLQFRGCKTNKKFLKITVILIGNKMV